MLTTSPAEERSRERALDPNTSIDELLNLAVRYPREVLSNPSLKLEMVVKPDLGRTMQAPQLQALVRYPEVPDLLITQAIERTQAASYVSDLAHALLANPRLTREQAQAVIANRGEGRFPDHTLANHAQLSDSFDERPALEILLAAFRDQHPLHTERFIGTGLENVPLTRAVYQEEKWRKWVAGAPFTPPALLAEIGRDQHGPTISALIDNPNTPGETLADFYQRYKDKPETLQGLAKHPNLPEAIRAALLVDAPSGALTGLALNPSLTPEQQMQLAARDDSATRQFLCNNPSLTVEAQVHLARTGDYEVQRQLLRRRTTAPEALEILKRSEDRIVALSARSHVSHDTAATAADEGPLSEFINYLRVQGGERAHALLAGTSHNAPALLLDALAASGQPLQRLAAAIHPNTRPETRELLAIDPDRRVAKAAQEPPCQLK